jgi:hypothetical protein
LYKFTIRTGNVGGKYNSGPNCSESGEETSDADAVQEMGEERGMAQCLEHEILKILWESTMFRAFANQ